MMKALLLSMAAAAVISSSAWAADELNPGMTPSDNVRAMGNDISDAISANPDKAFAAAVISHARLQRQINTLVAEKATNPQIKKYAQDLADDMDKFAAKVKDAADKAGITIQQDRMLPRDQAVLDFLKQLPVASLERNYIFYEAGATNTHLLMCQWVAKNAQKPEVKQVAQDFVEKVQARHDMAEKLAQGEISNGMHMATENQ